MENSGYVVAVIVVVVVVIIDYYHWRDNSMPSTIDAVRVWLKIEPTDSSKSNNITSYNLSSHTVVYYAAVL